MQEHLEIAQGREGAEVQQDLAEVEEALRALDDARNEAGRLWVSEDGSNHLVVMEDGHIQLCIQERCYDADPELVNVEQLVKNLQVLGVLKTE